MLYFTVLGIEKTVCKTANFARLFHHNFVTGQLLIPKYRKQLTPMPFTKCYTQDPTHTKLTTGVSRYNITSQETYLEIISAGHIESRITKKESNSKRKESHFLKELYCRVGGE